MSNEVAIPVAANIARLVGYRDNYLDVGPDDPKLHLFGTTRPSPGAAAGGDPLVTILLAKPSGEIVAGKLQLIMKDAGGFMALLSGDALWGRLETADGLWAGDGDVSDEAGDGVFKLAGTGTAIQAGGYVILGTTALE